MKSKYSTHPEVSQTNATDLIELGKEKKSTTFWRTVILSKKLSTKQLKHILSFTGGKLNITLILEQIGYPKKIDNILLNNIVKALKHTNAHRERERIVHFLFPFPNGMSMANAEILAQKIDAIYAWDRFVYTKGHVMSNSNLVKIGNQYHDSSLWWTIVLRSRNLKIEQIQYILKESCFSDNNRYKKLLLEAILKNYYWEYPLFCVDILIQYMDLGGIPSDKNGPSVNSILGRVDLHELELDQLVRLYYRTKEKVVLEAMFLKCVSFSKDDLSGLLERGEKKTKDFILSRVSI